ncbi:MAG: DNA polymerase III subunit delta [Christensenella sp.]|nr:DNA polymerase III subunit delta [Christensenella sp.]
MRALGLKVDENNLSSGYILSGDDEAIKGFIKETFLATIPASERGFAYVTVDISGSKNVEDIIQAADMFCFASCKKMIYVEPITCKLEAKSIKQLKEYFDNPNPTSFVVFEDIGLNDFSSFDNCEFVDCTKASEDELYQYIYKKLTEKGYSMNGIAIRGFIRYCNCNFGKISSELSKLMLYCMDSKVINKEDYEMLTAPDLEVDVFKLINNLNTRNYTQALKILDKLQETGLSNRIIFKTLQTSYKRLFYIACSQSSDAVISKSLGISNYAINANRTIIANNKTNKTFIKSLKEIVDYLFYLEEKMLSFVINEKDVMKLAIDRIIELMEIKKDERKF